MSEPVFVAGRIHQHQGETKDFFGPQCSLASGPVLVSYPVQDLLEGADFLVG
jgi:hypothetical protein